MGVADFNKLFTMGENRMEQNKTVKKIFEHSLPDVPRKRRIFTIETRPDVVILTLEGGITDSEGEYVCLISPKSKTYTNNAGVLALIDVFIHERTQGYTLIKEVIV